jgi:hypothetical protein
MSNSLAIHERERGRVRLYSCGGAGINIGSKIAPFQNEKSAAFAQLDCTFVDTSKSNLHSKIDSDNIYLVDGLDGSGQVRKENYEAIAERVRDILQTHKPVDLNIVLSSGGGGSGSVIAPSIVSELLAKDFPTVVICVGDDSTKKFAENTLNTLKSYDNIATKTRKKPVVMFYVQNGADLPRTEVDRRIQELVASLCMLYSRRNRELDSKDLYNWLNYQNVTSHAPSLTALTLVDTLNPSVLGRLGNLISIATLTSDDVDSTLPIRPEVQYVGYVEEAYADATFKAPYHYVTSDGIFADVAAHLNGVLKESAEQSDARVRKTTISTNADLATDNGVVL